MQYFSLVTSIKCLLKFSVKILKMKLYHDRNHKTESEGGREGQPFWKLRNRLIPNVHMLPLFTFCIGKFKIPFDVIQEVLLYRIFVPHCIRDRRKFCENKGNFDHRFVWKTCVSRMNVISPPTLESFSLLFFRQTKLSQTLNVTRPKKVSITIKLCFYCAYRNIAIEFKIRWMEFLDLTRKKQLPFKLPYLLSFAVAKCTFLNTNCTLIEVTRHK